MNRFFSKLDLRDIKIDPNSSRFPPDAEDEPEYEEVQDNVDRGMSPEEARRRAMLRFGNVALVKEDTRAAWV